MDYYLNEYSLRGQFGSAEEFYASMRRQTLPAIKEIEEEEGCIILKKDTFWQLEVCNGMTLKDCSYRKNTRNAEITYLLSELRKLVMKEPFWDASEADTDSLEVSEYLFDVEFRDKFESVNCFTKAARGNGAIISFEHREYRQEELELIVTVKPRASGGDGEHSNAGGIKVWTDGSRKAERKIRLRNCYKPSRKREKGDLVQKWDVNSKCKAEVRFSEPENHQPHFHVTCDGESASFRISDGAMIRGTGNRWPSQWNREIAEWYCEHKDELSEAWAGLHGPSDCD